MVLQPTLMAIPLRHRPPDRRRAQGSPSLRAGAPLAATSCRRLSPLALTVSLSDWFSAGFGHTLWLLQEHGARAGSRPSTNPTSMCRASCTSSRWPTCSRRSHHPPLRRSAAAPLAASRTAGAPVFALGTVLCYVGQGIKSHTGENFVIDTALIVTGLALQYALAYSRQYWPRDRTA